MVIRKVGLQYTCNLVASCLKTERLAPSHSDCWMLLENKDHISRVKPPVSFPDSPTKYVFTFLRLVEIVRGWIY